MRTRLAGVCVCVMGVHTSIPVIILQYNRNYIHHMQPNLMGIYLKHCMLIEAWYYDKSFLVVMITKIAWRLLY